MQPFARPIVGIALFAGVLSPFLLSSRSATSVPLASTDPILEVHANGLTTYRYSGNTLIQGIRPLVGQRGVNLDGSYRAAPSQRMAIQGNPFEKAWGPFRVNDMRLDTGTYAAQDVDIALPAEGFSWVIGRTYNARQQDSGGTARDSNGYQGYNWFQNSQPEIRLYDTLPDSKDEIYVVYGADRFVEYRLDTSSSYVIYRGTNGAAGLIHRIIDSGGPDTYVLYDQNGNTITFFAFDTQSGVAKGQLWKIVDAAGNTAYIGDATTGSTAITNGFDASGYVTTAYDTSGRKYSYTYSSFDSVSRLSQVKAEINTGSWVTVATVDYDYYLSGQSNGSSGDLRKVTITTPLTDSGVDLVQKKYYRYWTGTYNSSSNPGYPHTTKYIVDFEGTRRRDWEDSNFDEDFLSDSDATLAEYSSAYFEYDSSHQVRKAWFNGQCGCGGGSQNGTFEFTYDLYGSFSDNTGAYDTAWKTRTIVKRPDLTYVTQYWDEANQPLSQLTTNQDPSITSPAPEKWVTAITRDGNGMVTSIASPANCTGYTHSSGAISSSTTVGLVNDFTRQSSGATKSFAITRYFKKGTGTQYYEREWEWTSANVAIQDLHIIRPVLDKVHDYQVQGTSTTNRITTEHNVTFHSGTLAIDDDEMVEPAIDTAKNGSGTGNDADPCYRQDETLSFSKARDGVITYEQFTDGRMTKRIEDVDTTETGDFGGESVPGAVGSTSGTLHRITTHAYDNQGRPDLTTYADGRKIKRYYSRLADRRQVVLEYNDYTTSPSTKFYGPVRYTLLNQAGKVEANGIVSLTSNESTSALTAHVDESDADLITAIDLGTVAQLTTQLFKKSGTVLDERRVYFTVPSSGAGNATDNYDPTFFAYDDMGRQDRVKEAHGTIRSKVFDDLERVVSIWLGTNDAEETGTDDMVMIESREYDGGDDDGNSYLTERILFVEDSAADQRVTAYAHDLRGRILLETRPESPHALHQYDNQGRRTATGLFSSTGSIVVGTDEPTSETASRMALTEWAYDEIGQRWKTIRHRIEAGADADSLEALVWHDKNGRVLKTDGPDLVKNVYDALGRMTHRFVLAEDNDTTYAQVDDVTDDYVVEETQSVFDVNTDEMLMTVRIDRRHDDWGGGSTTGALDTNSDGDRLLVTAANVEGRAQITSFWYDRFWRKIDEVVYGTNGGSNFDRDGLSQPTRSDNELRTTYSYTTSGFLEDTTDPRALVMRKTYDALGRATKEISNYTNGTPTAPDLNQTVIYTFTDGLLTTMLVDMPGSEPDQDTNYTYGTTKGTSAGDSKIGTKHLLQMVEYPDSAISDDVVRMAYNAQGQLIWRKDQRHSTGDTANITEFKYDDAGRLEQERVTTPGTGFDTAVLRIARTYDSLGRADLVTQYNNASVGSGTVLDEVKHGYDGWGEVIKFQQDVNSAVGASGSVDDYEFASEYGDFTTGRNTLRRTSMTLPGGRAITLDYSLNKDSSLSRVSKLKDGATALVTYDYLGAGFEIGATYPQPGIYGKVYDPTSGNYTGLDRFNRIDRSRWTSDVSIPVDFYDCSVSYDRNSSITWVDDTVHSGLDVKYTMDGLDRVTDAEEGTKSGSSIISLKRRQQWTTLSHTGNWSRAKLDLDGDGFYTGGDEYDDTRGHNVANETETRDLDSNSGTTGNNYTLTSDAVGDLTNDGIYKYEYDAFRRLRRIKNQSDALVGEYRYNGLGYLIEIHEDTDGDGVDNDDAWFHPVYDEAWRTVGTYRSYWDVTGTPHRVYDTSPKEDYVLQMAGLDGRGGSSYINGVVCRNRDAGTNGSAWASQADGTLEERYFYCQNWRGDIAALVTSGRKLHEWGKFSPYGVPNCLPGADTNSDGDCDENDITQITTWRTGPPAHYDVRADVDLDHDVDANDESLAGGGVLDGDTFLGWGKLSNAGIRNRVGYAGYLHSETLPKSMHVRHRAYGAELGTWQQRDPNNYADGGNLYEYVKSQAVAFKDASGLVACPASETVDIFAGVYTCPSAGRIITNGYVRGGGVHVTGTPKPTSPGTCDFAGQTKLISISVHVDCECESGIPGDPCTLSIGGTSTGESSATLGAFATVTGPNGESWTGVSIPNPAWHTKATWLVGQFLPPFVGDVAGAIGDFMFPPSFPIDQRPPPTEVGCARCPE